MIFLNSKKGGQRGVGSILSISVLSMASVTAGLFMGTASAQTNNSYYYDANTQTQNNAAANTASNFGKLEDGRRVIYGADGTVFIEDAVGAGTYSSTTLSPSVSKAPRVLQSTTPDYTYDVGAYQAQAPQGRPVQGRAATADPYATLPSASLPSAQPRTQSRTQSYTDPATATHRDPYATQYGRQQQATPGYQVAPIQYGQPQKQRVVRDYLDWPKAEGYKKLPRYAKDIRRLIEDSSYTVQAFLEDSNYGALWRSAKNAKAIIIVPKMIRGGFVVGGSGGNAIAMSRLPDGTWSNPAFFTIGSASIGFQAGGDVSEMILLVMTNRGMEQLLSSSLKLGGDIAVAAGPYGAGAKAQTTDVLAFSQSKGLYGGVSLEGAYLRARYKWNDLYYGGKTPTADILIKDIVVNPNSEPVQVAVKRLTNIRLNTAPLEQR